MVPLFELMSTLGPMVVQRVLVLLHLSLQMMLSTPFSNSMVTIGKVAHLKSVRIDSLAHPDLVVVVVSAVDEAVSAVDLEVVVVVSVAVEEALVVDLQLAVVTEEVVSEHLVVSTEEELEPLLQCLTHSQTTPLPERIEARLFMSAT